MIGGVASSKLVNPGLHPRRCHRPPNGVAPRGHGLPGHPAVGWAPTGGPLCQGQGQPSRACQAEGSPRPRCQASAGPAVRLGAQLAGPASDGWLAQASDQHMAASGPAARSDQTRVQQPPHSRSDNSCGHGSDDRLLSDLGGVNTPRVHFALCCAPGWVWGFSARGRVRN